MGSKLWILVLGVVFAGLLGGGLFLLYRQGYLDEVGDMLHIPRHVKVSFINNDPSLNLIFNPDDQKLKTYIEALGLQKSNGVHDKKSDSLRYSINQIQVNVEPKDQAVPRIIDAQRRPFVSYDWSINHRILIIHVRVNYNLIGGSQTDKEHQYRGDLQFAIRYALAKTSSQYDEPATESNDPVMDTAEKLLPSNDMNFLTSVNILGAAE